MELRGVFPVLQLPYRADDSIDVPVLRREIDWVYQSRVGGIALGMASELVRLADHERDSLVSEVAGHLNGRGVLIAGAGGESVVQALRHAHAAERAGASVLMVPPPFLTRLGDRALIDYYLAVLDATGLPLMIQDASGYLAGPVPTAVQLRLYERAPGRILFKPEGPAMSETFSELLRATGGKARIYEGRGGLSLSESHGRGVAGVLPGSDVPWAIWALWSALEGGDAPRAGRIQSVLALFGPLLTNLDAFLAVEKTLLVRQGIFPSARVRPPVGWSLGPEAEAEIHRIFDLLRAACA